MANFLSSPEGALLGPRCYSVVSHVIFRGRGTLLDQVALQGECLGIVGNENLHMNYLLLVHSY